MKNHIKNYIKIMGLAAVPFGTAQATDYEIKVTQEKKPDAMHFKIAIREVGKEPRVVDIVWPHDKKCPNPLFEPNGFVEMYENKWKMRKKSFQIPGKEIDRYDFVEEIFSRACVWFRLLKWYDFYRHRLSVANWEYHVRKACEGFGLRVASPDFAEKIEKFIKNEDFAEEIKEFIGKDDDWLLPDNYWLLPLRLKGVVVLDVTNRSFKRLGGNLSDIPSSEKTHEFLFLDEYRKLLRKCNYVHYSYLLGGVVPYPRKSKWPLLEPRGFDFFLLRLEEKWLLVVDGFQHESDFVYVSSDVPTVCLNACGGVYADNEETDRYERTYVRASLSHDTHIFHPFDVLVVEKFMTHKNISHANDCNLRNRNLKGKERKCTCHEIVRVVPEERSIESCPPVVLRCKDGKVTHAWFDGNLSNVNMSYINNKPSNANVKRSYVSCTRLDIVRIARKMYERKCFKERNRKLDEPRTEDLSNVFTSEY